MSTVTYTNASQYYTTDQDTWYLDFWNYREIDEDSTDYYITLTGKYNERPDLLSYDEYGTVDYWWIFAILNKDKLIDPIYDMTEGIVLRLPTLSRLSNLLG